MDEIWSKRDELSALKGEDEREYDQVDEIQRVVFGLKRDMKKCLMQSQGNPKSVDSHSYSTSHMNTPSFNPPTMSASRHTPIMGQVLSTPSNIDSVHSSMSTPSFSPPNMSASRHTTYHES